LKEPYPEPETYTLPIDYEPIHLFNINFIAIEIKQYELAKEIYENQRKGNMLSGNLTKQINLLNIPSGQ
jgi:hypothetical protein